MKNYSSIKHIQKIQEIIARIKSKKNVKIGTAFTKKEKIILKICSAILSVFLVITLVVFSVFNHYLNKINYGDIENVAEANKEAVEKLDKEEELDFGFIDENKKNQTKTSKDKSDKKNQNNDTDFENIEYLESGGIGKEIQKKANNDIEKNISDNVLWYSEEVYNVLIAGYDAGGDNGESGNFHRSDAIIIASINKAKKSIRLISLSRATYAAIPGHGNKRLNTAHAYGGASLLVEAVELNYKVKIDRYITASFEGFIGLIDAIGGITLELTKTEADFVFNNDSLPGGEYYMNGTQALRYVRLRKTDSDRTRTGRQRKVLKKIITGVKTMNTSEKMKFLDAVLPFITTNFTRSEIVSKLSEANDYISWPVVQFIVPKKANPLEMRDGLEVIIVDWADTTKYIHSIMYDGVKAKIV